MKLKIQVLFGYSGFKILWNTSAVCLHIFVYIPDVTVFKHKDSWIEESHVAMAPTSLVKCRTIGKAKDLAPCSFGRIEWVP